MVNPEKYNDQITDYRKTILEFINRPEKEEDKLTIDDLVANDWKIKNNIEVIKPFLYESIFSFFESKFIFNPLTLCSEGKFSKEEIDIISLLLLHQLIFNPKYLVEQTTNLFLVEDPDVPEDTELKLNIDEKGYLNSISNVILSLHNSYLKDEEYVNIPYIEETPSIFKEDNEEEFRIEEFAIMLIRNKLNFVNDVFSSENIEFKLEEVE